MPRTKLGERYIGREERGHKALIEYVRSKTGGRDLMKLDDLAEKIGLSHTALSLRMNGRVKFSHTDILRICRVFDTSDEELLSFFGRGSQKGSNGKTA